MMKKTARRHVSQVEFVRGAIAGRHDDLFLCCTSFEERCVTSAQKLSDNYRSELSCIFRFMPSENEADAFDEARDRNGARLAKMLELKTNRSGPITIMCDKHNTEDGISQLRSILSAHYPEGVRSVTIDMSSFTKIYFWELLHFLVWVQGTEVVQVLYTQSRSIPSDALTAGAFPPLLIPKFGGRFSPIRKTLLLGFVGFEPQRAILTYEEFEPERAEILISFDPDRPEYFERSLKANSYLLTRPGVHWSRVHPFELGSILSTLENALCHDRPDRQVEARNVIFLSLGTKVQNLAGFVFWCRHQEIRLAYSFPTQYARDHLRLLPGATLSFNLKGDELRSPMMGIQASTNPT